MLSSGDWSYSATSPHRLAGLAPRSRVLDRVTHPSRSIGWPPAVVGERLAAARAGRAHRELLAEVHAALSQQHL